MSAHPMQKYGRSPSTVKNILIATQVPFTAPWRTKSLSPLSTAGFNKNEFSIPEIRFQYYTVLSCVISTACITYDTGSVPLLYFGTGPKKK